MAPEILLKRNYNHKVDIWALGVTVFELLTGRAPFYSTSKRDLKFKHCIGKYRVSGDL